MEYHSLKENPPAEVACRNELRRAWVDIERF